MPEFGILVLLAFVAGVIAFAFVLAYCSIVDGKSVHQAEDN